MKLIISETAKRNLEHLPKTVVRRILKKMIWYVSQPAPLSFAKPLKNSRFGDYRFRVGDYRILVEVKRNHISVLVVLAVRHRKEAYRL